MPIVLIYVIEEMSLNFGQKLISTIIAAYDYDDYISIIKY